MVQVPKCSNYLTPVYLAWLGVVGPGGIRCGACGPLWQPGAALGSPKAAPGLIFALQKNTKFLTRFLMVILTPKMLEKNLKK